MWRHFGLLQVIILEDRDLHKKLDPAKVPGDKTQTQGEIDAADRAIDNLVYELYGLTEEEIKIVEEAT